MLQPQTLSKSPRRCRKSKSPNPKGGKKKQSSELKDYLVAEAIQQNKDLLKIKIKNKNKDKNKNSELHFSLE